MKVFIGIVHKDKGSAYGIHFPDAPGCFSAADSMADLLPNAQEALALHLEDAEGSEARSIDEVSQDADVIESLQAGGMLLAVPVISLSGVSQRANITVDSHLLKDIDSIAKARGMNRSSFLAGLAKNEIFGERRPS